MSCEISFDDFVPDISVRTDGIPENVAAHFARVAAIEFARDTHIIRRTIWVDVQEGQQAYPLCVEDDYRILAISQVVLNGCELPAWPRGKRLAECMYRNWYVFEPPHNLMVAPVPCEDAAEALEVHLVVCPGQDSCSIDQIVYDLYAETITDGALARIYAMRGEDWEDIRLADQHRRLFHQAKALAKMRDQHNYSAAPVKMGMPRGVLV